MDLKPRWRVVLVVIIWIIDFVVEKSKRYFPWFPPGWRRRRTIIVF